MFAAAQPLVRHSIDVTASPDACWKILADFATWPRWFPRLKYASALDAGDPWRVGGRFEIVFDFGVEVSVKPIVEEIELARPGFKRVRWVGAGWGITGNHAYTLETVGNITRVTSHEEFSGMAARMLPKSILARLDNEVQRSLERYKALVESR